PAVEPGHASPRGEPERSAPAPRRPPEMPAERSRSDADDPGAIIDWLLGENRGGRSPTER
ncbi:MAG: hypothetical protein L0027_11745, partial [Candidatus Rokubacteria bacterium]|nr:hypothetical protein [Candidatus Rokubacteria bacterium]